MGALCRKVKLLQACKNAKNLKVFTKWGSMAASELDSPDLKARDGRLALAKANHVGPFPIGCPAKRRRVLRLSLP